ncbi:MAG: hypothetical protein GY821_18060 [Gammaproteobacteria bacterium]|nr:hypothetical protein [Gammaproteobacteria bacterium]
MINTQKNKRTIYFPEYFMGNAMKGVFTTGSVLSIMSYLKKLSDTYPLMKVFNPLWNYVDAIGYFVSAYYKWQNGKKQNGKWWQNRNRWSVALELVMSSMLTIITTVSLVILPWLATWGFAACMWQLFISSARDFFKNPSIEKFIDCTAWLCSSLGMTMLAISLTFPPLAPLLLLPGTILCAGMTSF